MEIHCFGKPGILGWLAQECVLFKLIDVCSFVCVCVGTAWLISEARWWRRFWLRELWRNQSSLWSQSPTATSTDTQSMTGTTRSRYTHTHTQTHSSLCLPGPVGSPLCPKHTLHKYTSAVLYKKYSVLFCSCLIFLLGTVKISALMQAINFSSLTALNI